MTESFDIFILLFSYIFYFFSLSNKYEHAACIFFMWNDIWNIIQWAMGEYINKLVNI